MTNMRICKILAIKVTKAPTSPIIAFSKSANCEKPYTVRVLEHLHDKTQYFAALQANIALKPFIPLAFSTIN